MCLIPNSWKPEFKTLLDRNSTVRKHTAKLRQINLSFTTILLVFFLSIIKKGLRISKVIVRIPISKTGQTIQWKKDNEYSTKHYTEN